MARQNQKDVDETAYDFQVQVSEDGNKMPRVASHAYWKISARMKPYLSFRLTVHDHQYRITMFPRSILSHPDGALFEKILWRERVLTGDPVEFEESVAGEIHDRETSTDAAAGEDGDKAQGEPE